MQGEQSRRLAEERARDADERKRLANIITNIASNAIDERNKAIRELTEERKRAAEERKQHLAIIENLSARLAEQNSSSA